MKKSLPAFAARLLLTCLSLCLLAAPARAESSAYTSAAVGGHGTKYVTIDMSSARAGMMLANNSIISTQSVADMAAANGAFAAVNGTYFEAYGGLPVPWGTIIQGGRLLHTGGGAVAGITADGRLLVDRLTFTFSGYVNDTLAFYPWWLNHPGTDGGAITIFTPEFTGTITPPPGAQVVLVDSGGQVTAITAGPYTVPAGGFALAFNADTAYLVPERFHVGDRVRYETHIQTTFTNAADWEQVTEAVGAGPSLIINGAVTADGEAEGFTEAKINTNRGGRSFIGATASGQILIGNISSATLQEAAAVCQQLSLVNAMCLDGGGSVALYHNGSKGAGRNVNNALGFFAGAAAQPQAPAGEAAYGRPQELVLDGRSVTLQAYNIGGNNYFKLRDLAWLLNGTQAQFAVEYDSARSVVVINPYGSYTAVGGEGALQPEQTVQVRPAQTDIIFNGVQRRMAAYNIGGNNYFQLRELGALLDFGVGYDSAARLVVIDSGAGYTG